METNPKILIVDDKMENLFTLHKLLQALEVEVYQSLSGFEALNLALEHDFCVAIVDIQMPGMDGYELVEMIRSNQVTSRLPVIFVSAIYSDEYHHRKGYEAGAVDFMSKPFVPEILLSKVRIFIDLYQQRQALQEANLALARLNADKDKFFSIISHDLRSPFNALLGNTELLVKDFDRWSRRDVDAMLLDIYRGTRVVYNLLEGLLTWSRLQRGDGMQTSPERVDLGGLVGRTLLVLEQAALQKEISLKSTIGPGCWVQADRMMLETIIRNLVSNAIKFTPRGGRVTLSETANLNGKSGFVQVAVQDTGIGMDPDSAAQLFRLDSSHTTLGTERERGSGLGLLICKEMVERNGGEIWVESEVGQGTTVKFTVPEVTLKVFSSLQT